MSRSKHDEAVAFAIHEGAEPVGAGIKPKDKEYVTKLHYAFNWFTRNKAEKDARKYLEFYIKTLPGKKEYVSGIASLNDNDIPLTAGWLARLVATGATLTKDHAGYLNEKVRGLFALVETRKALAKAAAKDLEKKGIKVKTIQELMAAKVNGFLGDCEGMFDDLIEHLHNSKKPFPHDDFFLKQLRVNETPAAYIPSVIEWCDAKIKEYGTVLIKPDEQLKEGYGQFSKRQLGEIVKWFGAIKAQCNEYAVFKKVNKAPRKRKAKPASVQAKNVKYQTENKEYGLTSLHPIELVAAQQIWLFNTKTRTLARFDASGPAGIGVKGTTLINWDTTTSEQKKLRKPKDVLAKLKDAGKVALRRILEDLRVKGKVPKGRINKDTIIVRVTR